jgi:hypothetical protein
MTRPTALRQDDLRRCRWLRIRAAALSDRHRPEWIGRGLAAYRLQHRASLWPQRRTGHDLAGHRGRGVGGRARPVGEDRDRDGARSDAVRRDG